MMVFIICTTTEVWIKDRKEGVLSRKGIECHKTKAKLEYEF